MMHQGKNKYVSGYAALKAMCEGFSSDQIAFHLIETNGMWQGKSLPTGAARVRACLSPEKNEYFSFGEILAIMQFTGHFDPIYYACDLYNMTRPVPKSREEQIAHLTGVIETASDAILAANQMLEGLVSGGSDNRSRTEDHHHAGKFCLDVKRRNF